jgi:hypothetical protein
MLFALSDYRRPLGCEVDPFTLPDEPDFRSLEPTLEIVASLSLYVMYLVLTFSRALTHYRRRRLVDFVCNVDFGSPSFAFLSFGIGWTGANREGREGRNKD